MRPWILPCLALVLAAHPALRGEAGPKAEDPPASEQPKPAYVLPPAALGRTWILASLRHDGEAASLPADTSIEFTLTEDGRVAGKAPVNRYFGRITKATLEGELVVGNRIATTRMAGPEKAMDLEALFLKALSAVTRCSVAEGRLTLAADDPARTELVFRPR